MKIGLIAYPTVCNFGANLQILSTLEYFRKRNIDIEIINWTPYSLEEGYKKGTPEVQRKAHQDFWDKYYVMSPLCRTAEDVAKVIVKDCITGVIVGSDAVAQHHPFVDRILFPSKRIIQFLTYSEDRMFPNVFWGTFQDYLDNKIPMAVMSASCQNSPYRLFGRKVKKQMAQRIKNYNYLSVRDIWTQKLYSYVTCGKIVPEVTPDPVFAFNYNVDYIPSRAEIINRFSLPQKYILLSFNTKMRINRDWIRSFQAIAHDNGYKCVSLTYPNCILFDDLADMCIKIPLSPLDWYAIIKYSGGYVGNNMHPIVVSIHNSVPFFCFDNYGVTRFRLFYNKESSKIYDILKRAGMVNSRANVTTFSSKIPKPSDVFGHIKNFDTDKCNNFAQSWYNVYLKMMDSIVDSLT